MTVWIALFRGINVGGRNSLAMKDLKELLEASGYLAVKTYIQSGNVTFQRTRSDAKKLPERVGKAVLASHGFRPAAIVMSLTELEQAVAANPFPDAQLEPKSLHFYFLENSPKQLAQAELNARKAKTESFAIVGNVFYLHAPEGIGRSKLAASAEKLLGVDATARNWRTVSKLLELARDV
ncbi:MAG: DUF1697 domain-containing protein [Pseudomonadota bacterium]